MIEDAWIKFSRQCLKPGAGPSSVHAARVAFFAGATAMLSMMSATTDAPVDEAIACFDRWVAELERFGDSLGEGRATR